LLLFASTSQCSPRLGDPARGVSLLLPLDSSEAHTNLRAVVIGEIFPLPIRSRGVGLSTSSNWFWNCIIAIITPYLVDKQYANLSSKIFFMWGSLCIISVLFAFFLVPETKGLSLEQVDRMLEEVSPRKSRSWVPHSTFAAEMGLVEKGMPLPGGKHGDSAEETEIETQNVQPTKEVV
jgi:hypothetical protein